MKVNKEKPNSDKGFTLIEVLLAIVILSLVSAPILRGFIVTANTSARARTILEATDVAQLIVEEISATTFEDTDGFKDTFLATASKERISSVGYTASGDSSYATLIQAQFVGKMVDLTENPGDASYPLKTCYFNGQAGDDGSKIVAMTNVEYDGKKYDVMISYKPNSSEGTKYYTYDIRVKVYGQDVAADSVKHFQHLFVTLDTQISNKY